MPNQMVIQLCSFRLWFGMGICWPGLYHLGWTKGDDWGVTLLIMNIKFLSSAEAEAGCPGRLDHCSLLYYDYLNSQAFHSALTEFWASLYLSLGDWDGPGAPACVSPHKSTIWQPPCLRWLRWFWMRCRCCPESGFKVRFGGVAKTSWPPTQSWVLFKLFQDFLMRQDIHCT